MNEAEAAEPVPDVDHHHAVVPRLEHLPPPPCNTWRARVWAVVSRRKAEHDCGRTVTVTAHSQSTSQHNHSTELPTLIATRCRNESHSQSQSRLQSQSQSQHSRRHSRRAIQKPRGMIHHSGDAAVGRAGVPGQGARGMSTRGHRKALLALPMHVTMHATVGGIDVVSTVGNGGAV